jgi:nitrogen fixation/metabolism regulation signal transduction histidine kinase
MRNGKSEKTGRSGTSLRLRLALMLALFALVPSLVVTFLASQRIAGSLDLMNSPGVTRTLDGAFNVSRTSLGRLEVALHATSLAAAGDPTVVPPRLAGDSLSAPIQLASALEHYSVDYASIYVRIGEGGWQLAAEERVPDHSEAPSPELPRPLAPGLHYDRAGWLVDAVPASAGDVLLVLGYYMGPSFFSQVEELGKGMGFFRQLEVLKGVYVGGIWIWAAGLILVVGLATLLTARWAARGLSRPLVELADGMRSVARGQEGVVVRPTGSRETKFLASTFNSMVAQLAAYKRDLALAERAAAWQDIARVAAHEIRNPLTPIQFAIRRIRDRVKSMPEADQADLGESLDSILGEVDTLKALASSFSQFAKLPEPSPAPENLNKLASEAVELFGEEKSVDFSLDLEDALPDANLDASQIRMVLNNLLKNSTEAMPGGGSVTVRTRLEGQAGDSWILLEVEDQGQGMDEATLAKATDPYFSTKTKGSGLGLAVVHKIALQHGGRMEIASRPGAGTKVSLHLPVRREPRGSQVQEPGPEGAKARPGS